MGGDMATIYGAEFFEKIREGSRRSAEIIVPLICELTTPASVIDVGCGTGSWLAVFRERGVADVSGVDGDYVDVSALPIPPDRFITRDLTQPFRLAREFDLAMSIEVAEHLPASCAAAFVDSLTRLAPVILFSAAVPHQGGQGHINEQWPDYWADLFHRHNYAVIDAIRGEIWNNPDVEWWYAQNLLLFVREPYLASSPMLEVARERTNMRQLSLVHPRKYLELVDWYAVHYERTIERLDSTG
jgi:SAM-dependent methyltransferase